MKNSLIINESSTTNYINSFKNKLKALEKIIGKYDLNTYFRTTKSTQGVKVKKNENNDILKDYND